MSDEANHQFGTPVRPQSARSRRSLATHEARAQRPRGRQQSARTGLRPSRGPMRKTMSPASHTPRWLASLTLAVVSAGLVACMSTEPQLADTRAPGVPAFNPGAELLYCAHLRTGLQRRATGVGPVFDKFSADTLGQIRDVVVKYLPESAYAREEDAARTRAWHDISDYEMRRAKMFPGARDDFIKRAQYCDGLFGRLAPGRMLPAFEQRCYVCRCSGPAVAGCPLDF
jgi:hypothetical protein